MPAPNYIPVLESGHPLPPATLPRARSRREKDSVRRNPVNAAKHGQSILIPKFQLASYLPYISERGWHYRYMDAGTREFGNRWRLDGSGKETLRCCRLFFLDPCAVRFAEHDVVFIRHSAQHKSHGLKVGTIVSVHASGVDFAVEINKDDSSCDVIDLHASEITK